ncbi:MAG TPA: hypothetical protein DCE71_07260 [Parachlamydiales bacterium]|nr:hypothetical protein [Parachlamydiales bacterium]
MRLIFSILIGLFAYPYLQADEYNIPPSIRFTIDREGSSPPLVYYFTSPDYADKTYPILVLCEGSTSKGDLRSVCWFREYFSEKIRPLQVGYLTVEQWGIDGNQIDENEFWRHYTRSQRLDDHLQVIHHLKDYPPAGWNGQLIFIGVSEGGPLVTDLSILCSNTLATINWVGAGDQSWADELWQFFEHWKENSFWMRLYDAVPRWLPFSSDLPPTRQEYDTLVQEIIANPNPDLRFGGMTYLYHADAFQKSPIDYSKIRAPFLVVEGTEDSTIDSCDQFVQKALAAGAPITYFRIQGMDHWLRKRPDIIDQSFKWLEEILQTGESTLLIGQENNG